MFAAVGDDNGRNEEGIGGMGIGWEGRCNR